jgi:hypothetical protein
MARVKQTTPKVSEKRPRPALTPEARENQLIAMAVDMAEEQLMNRTASSQVLTHYLKLATVKEKLELKKLESEINLQNAKAEQVKSMQRSEELMAEAIKAFKEYSGRGEDRYDD